MLASAASSLDVAIFSISDDRLEKALRDAHRRGVAVRVISDDDTALNSGSKLFALAREGIATAVDSAIDVRASGGKVEALPRHMHHKFAIVDGRLLLTGSYNWTYSAASVNCENALATDDMLFVERYAAEFTRMWTRFHAKTRRASNVTLLPLPELSQSMPLRAWHHSCVAPLASSCSLACSAALYACALQVHEAALTIQSIERGRIGRRRSVALPQVREHEAPPPPGKDDFPALGSWLKPGF
jgi:phosphatidylserine/phosphatidylglycerophosphate/cardiolipin synthase-like enzyme